MDLFAAALLRRQARKLFFHALKLSQNLKLRGSKETNALIKAKLERFQNQILLNTPPLTKEDVKDFKNFKKEYLDLKGGRKWFHFTYTTIFALAIALLIRQVWFELYKVPTGSMRPTIKELDHLTVSKLNFSLNVPFTPKHFYFNPDLVKRSSICVFTSENMDVYDSDTMYFYLIPGKKLLVKRLIAKPNDTVYFYGGKIYGIDAQGHDITNELNPENISHIDHIPFINWLGEKDLSQAQNKYTIYHMNAPYVTVDSSGRFEFSIPKNLQSQADFTDVNMSAPWGLDHFAQARILNNQTKKKLYPFDSCYSSKGLYLELKHHLHSTATKAYDQSSPLRLESSIIPLDDTMSSTLFENLYTSRFEVKSGSLRRYGSSIPFGSKQLPKLHHIPDGTYEFYDGEAYRIYLMGISKKLEKTHPIYRFSPTALETFFNLGIEFNTYFTPGQYDSWAPPRYSYFRDGDLFVMGRPFLKSDDPILKKFVENEKSIGIDHMPFIDQGAPLLADGSLDKDKILKLGMKVPEKMYFVLGDNHSQSADSRVFGFVPQENLKGCPDIIFWPPGSRFGHLPQALMETFTLPRTIVWSGAWIIGILWLRHRKKHNVLPKDLSFLD